MKILNHEINRFAPKKKALHTKKGVVIYTRVSTKDQTDNTSLETQRRTCELYAFNNGLQIIKYFGGTYESAKSDKERKEFQNMLSFVRNSKDVGAILVYSYDRFSRTGTSAASISDDLNKLGIVVKAVSQDVNSETAAGKFQERLFYMFSQFDNDMRRDKTMTGMIDLLRKGYWLWIPPRGYENLNKNSKAVDSNIVINKEGLLLKKAFEWKVNGQYSNVNIVKNLKELGMEITEKKLSATFRNPFYCGIIVSKLIPEEIIQGRHEKIVTVEDFLKINSTVKKKKSGNHEKFPLKGTIKCSKCNRPLTGFEVKKKGLLYYKCPSKGCSNTQNSKIIHSKFIDVLMRYQIDENFSEVVTDVMTEVYKELTSDYQMKVNQKENELNECKVKLKKIEERFALGEIEHDMYSEFSKQYKLHIAEITVKIDNYENKSSNLNKCITNAINMSKNIGKVWNLGDLEAKKRIQNILFPKGLTYDKDFDLVQTSYVNSLFVTLSAFSSMIKLKEEKRGNLLYMIPPLVTPEGF